jgi:predicted amidohydrolase
MRLAVTNANVVTGDGKTILENCSVVIEDEIIVDIPSAQYLYYDPADRIIDAHGNLVIPGIITSHQHGVTFAPLFSTGQPPLPEGRIRANLDRLLSQGVTTLQSQDGLGTMDEVRRTDKIHPINIKTGTAHTPKNLALADSPDFRFGGIGKKHWGTTIDEMVRLGASCIGEIGTGIDAHYPDTILLPMAVKARTGYTLSATDARLLHQLRERDDLADLGLRLKELGLAEALSVSDVCDLFERVARWCSLAREAAEEGIEAARRLDMPIVIHNSPETQPLVVEAAKELGRRLVAAHCNFRFDVDGALAQAKRLRQLGAYLDIHTGDMFGVRFFVQSPDVTYALFANGLVDTISTDYIGGYWDPILLTLERVVEAGHVTLAQAIATATSNVVAAFPRLAPNRGLVERGKVADLVIVNRERIGRIETVIIGGKVVVERAEDPGLRIVY